MRRLALPLVLLLTAGCGSSPEPPAGRPQARPAPEPLAERPPPPAPPADALLEEVTASAGIDFVHRNGATPRKVLPETMGAGGCALDHDGDGRMDLLLVDSGTLTGGAGRGHRLYGNLGGGRFEDRSELLDFVDGAYGQGAACADYDGDGDTDAYLSGFGANALLRNDGGRFVNVAAEAGVDDGAWGASAAWLDADGDGDLDLFVVNYLDVTLETHVDCGDVAGGRLQYCHPDVYPGVADRLFLNRGDGRFEDATQRAGLAELRGKGLGVVASDLDLDGDVDLYVANDSTPNFLLVNDGDGRFREDGLLAGVAYNAEGDTEAGMGVDAGDVDGDGRFDLVVTNLSREANALYLSQPPGWRHASRRAGLHEASLPHVGFGTDLLDLDLDGHLDLVVTNGHVVDNIELFDEGLAWKQPSQVFLGDGSGRFAPVAPERLGGLAEPRVGRGTITLDFDDDGRLDLLLTFNGDRARLFRNVAAPQGRWLGLALRGRAPNTGAIGARAVVEAGGRRWIAEARAGGSYLTSNDPRLHFGLGDVETLDRVTVRWPDGAEQVLEGLALDAWNEVRQAPP